MQDSLNRNIAVIVIALVTLYLGTGVFLLAAIISISLALVRRKQAFELVMLFFALTFLLPHDLLLVVLDLNVSDFVDNSFVAGIPLYLGLGLSLRSWKRLPGAPRFFLFLFFVLFVTSTVVAIAGYYLHWSSVRLSFSTAINYMNGFLVAVLAYEAFHAEKDYARFSRVMAFIGICAAIPGLVQYFLRFYFFKNTYGYESFERLTLVSHSDPVDLFPYIIIPFSFGICFWIRDIPRVSRIAGISSIILLLTAFFTWSRWGFACLFAMFALASLLAGQPRIVGRAIVAVVVVYLLGSGFVQSEMASRDQQGRVGSETNLVLRFVLLVAGVNALSENPGGVGLGNGPRVAFEGINDFGQLLPGGVNVDFDGTNIVFQTLHSFFLDWVLSMGIVMIPILAAAFYVTTRNLVAARQTAGSPTEVAFVEALMCGGVGLVLFYSQNSGNTYYYFFFLMVVSYRLRKLAASSGCMTDQLSDCPAHAATKGPGE